MLVAHLFFQSIHAVLELADLSDIFHIAIISGCDCMIHRTDGRCGDFFKVLDTRLRKSKLMFLQVLSCLCEIFRMVSNAL